ncbi:hypothetical protein [Spirillospora sp. NPDC047279]|uniref:hypothetical protein n=1 Tax=Spirillospora sp. NPDC047279 TaxID=3155478 RepID=UPI00340AE118
MSLSITPTWITSTTVDDQAVRCHDGAWLLSGPTFGPVHIVDRPKALVAMAILDAIKTIHPGGPCAGCQSWLDQVTTLLAPEHPAAALVSGPATQVIHDEPESHPAGPDGIVRCLYCGSSDDIYETRVTIDDRTDEYALTCGHCHGVWAA